jgi:uncharacterized protein YkwD
MRRICLTVLLLVSLFAVRPAQAAGSLFFIETGFAIEGRFLEYWESQGGLAQFGFPISPVLTEAGEDGKMRPVQYFERNRFELHPEKGQPYDVLLSRLGVRILEARGVNWRTLPTSAPRGGCQHFAETGHNLCEPFASYWRSHGGLAIFGLPISDAFPETSSTDGKTYTVQYFERNRFEHHPNEPAYQVQLGLLGSEVSRGSFKSASVTIGSTLQRLVDLVNAARQNAGLGQVTTSGRLMVIAGSYSRVQAAQGNISHTGPDGAHIGERLSRGGYNWSVCGENLAAGPASPDEVFGMWMNSPGHRGVILNPKVREIGVGWTQRSGAMSNYWVLMVAAPR